MIRLARGGIFTLVVTALVVAMMAARASPLCPGFHMCEPSFNDFDGLIFMILLGASVAAAFEVWFRTLARERRALRDLHQLAERVGAPAELVAAIAAARAAPESEISRFHLTDIDEWYPPTEASRAR